MNVFLAFQSLRIYQRRRVSPGALSPRQAGRNHPVSSKMGTFAALHRNSRRESAPGRMFLPSVFPAVRSFPGNIHLQFLAYRKGLLQDILQHHLQLEIWEKGWELAQTCGSGGFWGTHNEEMLWEQREDGDNFTSPWDATAKGLLRVWGRSSLNRKASRRIGDSLVSWESTRACGWLSLLISYLPVQRLQDSLPLAVDQIQIFMNKP